MVWRRLGRKAEGRALGKVGKMQGGIKSESMTGTEPTEMGNEMQVQAHGSERQERS